MDDICPNISIYYPWYIMQPRPIDDQLYNLSVRYREFIRRFISMQVLNITNYRNNPNRIPDSYYSMFLDLLFEN